MLEAFGVANPGTRWAPTIYKWGYGAPINGLGLLHPYFRGVISPYFFPGFPGPTLQVHNSLESESDF